MLPAVEVRLTALEVRGAAKLPWTMLFAADRVMEFGAVTPPANEKPPLVEVRTRSVALRLMPAADEMLPLESRLNVAAAPEDADNTLDAPVFCKKTFWPAPLALADRFEAFTTSLLLPARSPTLPAVDVRLTVLDVSGAVKLPLVMEF